MFPNAFQIWVEREGSDTGPREYVQLAYNGELGRFAGEFSLGDLEDLKDAIRNLEMQYRAR